MHSKTPHIRVDLKVRITTHLPVHPFPMYLWWANRNIIVRTQAIIMCMLVMLASFVTLVPRVRRDRDTGYRIDLFRLISGPGPERWPAGLGLTRDPLSREGYPPPKLSGHKHICILFQ